MRYPFLKIITILSILCLFTPNLSWAKIDPTIFAEMKARCIGPASMSGRIADIDVVLSNPDTIYVGTATGGVWKSTNGGITWKPIFDDQPTSSIGAVKIFQKNPNIIWVGTGEANPRNSSGVGRGVFKSIDAGKTWVKMGLEKTEKISRILLDPYDPDIAFVAAMGTTWGENPQRGVFKTTDGGKTWEKILYVNEKTGVADLVMAPNNPNKLIAAMWEHRRWPWFFKSGGPGSGIYITTSGGEKWKKITDKDGLPEGELGRIGLAFAPNKPEIVYALVEAKKNALLKSIDGGFTWKTVNKKKWVSGRPFYYSDIRVNPQNENIVYSLQSRLNVSEDGGKVFRSLTTFTQSHSDYQAMWIHPDGEFMIVGNDGGVVITKDRGKNWRFIQNLPLGQFYHISYDMEIPYNIYGGLQDNGSWRGPNTNFTGQAVFNYQWQMVGSGDGFDTEPDPTNPDCGYSMSQGGRLMYFNHKTGLRKSIRPTETDIKHRYNWNAGFAIDPFAPSTIYYGSQFVHRSKDKGNTWEIISPDLTTGDPEKQKQDESGGLTLDVTHAENHTTILCIAPSPVKKGVIWVGTDDGNVQVTKDDGKKWELVSETLRKTRKRKDGVPKGIWIPHVEASKFNAATAFVVFDDHRRSNWKTYIFATHDFGRTWKSLTTPEIDGFVHVIEQDHVNKNLLFLGTEFGLYISFNGGKEWMKWTHGIPTAPVRDLSIHPRENDLIIGTHGRSAFILDDISPLRNTNEIILKKKVHLFDISDTIQFRTGRASAYLSPGDTAFKGKNREYGAIITYILNPEKTKKESRKVKKPKKKEITNIEILDQKGSVIRELIGTAKKGINRITWDLRQKGFESVRGPRQMGHERPGIFVLPGTYMVQIKYKVHEVKKPVNVKSDPRLNIDSRIVKENYELSMEIGSWIESVARCHKKIIKTRKVITTIKEYLKESKMEKKRKEELIKSGEQLNKKLKKVELKIVPDQEKQGIIRTDHIMSRKVNSVFRLIRDSYEPITQAAQVKHNKVKPELDRLLDEFNTLFETDVEKYKNLVKDSGFTLFESFEPIKIKK